MIVRPRPNLFHLFFIWRGSIVPHILPELLFVTISSSLITLAARYYGTVFPDYSAAPYALLGLAFSIFLGFRNNACYDRWWEARRQWGQLIVELRSLARDTQVLAPRGEAEGEIVRRRLVRRSLGFAHALVARLRNRPPLESASPYLAEGEQTTLATSRNAPDAILRLLGLDLAQALAAGLLSDIVYRGLCDRLVTLSGIQAACERIRH
ncbi:MAG: bestrophin family protein, partial [Betaproteobacteria bacterium]|nr:bestrophin family protein [Betaproteobacteria bacterium]